MKHFAVVAVVGLVVLVATMGARGSPAGEIALDETRLSQTPAPKPTRRSERIRIPELVVASPDGTVRFTLLANAERLTYTVTLDGATVLEPSPLAMHLDGYELSTGAVLNGDERYDGNETYPWRGARSTAVSAFNGARLSLTNDLTSTNYTLEIRAFNDGVAYRHLIPGEPSSSRVPDEFSTFNPPADSTAWYAGMAEGHYEAPYVRKTVAEVRAGEWAGPPLTVKLPRDGGYAAITEANLVNYSGMGLESNGRGGWVIGLGHRQPLNYPFELRYGRAEGKRLGRAAAVTGPIATPWRVVMVGRDLNALVNSTILPNLCPPPDLALFPQGLATSWIKPGRAVWRYVDGGPTGLDGMKEFSRLAGQLGYEHHVIEGLWAKWTMEERRDLVEFSKQMGVGVWFWRHSNQLRTPQAQDEFFTMLRDLGVVGAKIDFFDHEAKEVIDLYETAAAKGRRASDPRQLSRRQQADRPRAHVAERAGSRSDSRHGVERPDGAGASPDHRAFYAVSRRTGGVHDDGVLRAAQGYDGGPSDRQSGDLLEPAADRGREPATHPGESGRGRDQEHSRDVGRDDRPTGFGDRRAGGVRAPHRPHLGRRRYERPRRTIGARAADLPGSR